MLHAKYQLMEVLGVGSTSTCHRCLNKKSDLHFACKIIDKRLIEDRFQGMMEQFHTEIEALRNLQHPNIIQLYDVYITEEKIFIVMELMEGGELFDYVVQKGTLTEDEAATIVRSVTSALVYMHSKNIVHRDLKPENLLLRRRPRQAGDSIEVKIIDFGLSKVRNEKRDCLLPSSAYRSIPNIRWHSVWRSPWLEVSWERGAI
jgi:serine/threonine protein kinase